MTIQVENEASKGVKIAINQWGTLGKTEYFTIEEGHSRKWNRTDNRGFVILGNINPLGKPFLAFRVRPVLGKQDG